MCVLTTKGEETSSDAPTPDLIFTHGAGGTLNSEAIADFVEGFASSGLAILCFQGNMNLRSRVKMFKAVVESQEGQVSRKCVGGRSMGARAAILAAPAETSHYVLISYPLHTDKQVRDEILLELPESAKVIFVSGDRDSMCEIHRLDAVREKMRCRTWRVVVEGADHGMTVKPKAGTKPVGLKTGEVVAGWLQGDYLGDGREGKIVWDGEAERAEWSGWA
ncbi:MAG: hypothetical protein LQ346_004589 [Caloplaca aetnensis]|nr:MAG: hypothetical protein LQ346_004589 [Caloplaca aetnensis]